MRGYGNAARYAAQAAIAATAAVLVRASSDSAAAIEAVDAAAGTLGTGYSIGDGTLRAQIEDLQARVDALEP